MPFFNRPAAGPVISSLPITLNRIDCSFLDFEYKQKTNAVKPQLDKNGYSPVDWIACLQRVKPSDMPLGINEKFSQLRLRPVESTGYQKWGLVPGNLWTQKIDVAYMLIEMALVDLHTFIRPLEDQLALEDNNEGVYFLRAYSGAMQNHTQDGREEYPATNVIQDANFGSNLAMTLNLVFAALDYWSLIDGDMKTWERLMVKKIIQNSSRAVWKEISELQNAKDLSLKLKILNRVVLEITKLIANATAGAKATKWREKCKSDISKMLSKINPLLEVLSRVSSAGRILERMLGLSGYMVNPYGLEMIPGPSPMETAILVAGDPFTPKITNIAPAEGGPGTSVTIFGERFALRPENNVVYMDPERRYKAKVLAVRNQSEMEISIPEGISYGQTYPIILETVSSMNEVRSPKSFLGRRNPLVTGLSKNIGFAPIDPQTSTPGDPYADVFKNFIGSSVTIFGRGFYDPKSGNDQLIFGDKQYSISAESNDTYTFLVPPVLPKTYPVYLLFPSLNNRKSIAYDFEVLGIPVLSEVSPKAVKLGEKIIMKGSNFGEDKETAFVQIGYEKIDLKQIPGSEISNNQIAFRLPSIFSEHLGETMDAAVRTPAGKSNTITITIEKGFAETVWDALPPGSILKVTNASAGLIPDGTISLDEAAAMARGAINPYAAPWDDQNIETYQNYHQQTNASGGLDWKKGETVIKKTPGGPGPEFNKKYNVWNYPDGHTDIEEIPTLDEGDKPGFEEGDAIDGKNVGANYNDTIIIGNELSNQVISCLDFTLGNGDTVTINESNPVRVTGKGLSLLSGNSIQIGSLISEKGTAITITGNANTIATTITKCPEDAVVVENGIKNTLNLAVLQCGKTGLVIRGGGGNILTGNYSYNHFSIVTAIQKCIANGIMLEKTAFNQIKNMVVGECGGAGLYVTNAPDNQLYSVDSSNNAGTGIILEDSTVTAKSVKCLGNLIGMELRGAKTKDNTFEYLTTIPSDNSTIKRQQHALYIHGGANGNEFGGSLGYTSSHGVVIDGEGTDKNTVSLNLKDCGGDGVQIRGGAQGNLAGGTIEMCGENGVHILGGAQNNTVKGYISECGGNGISITGADTESNRIEYCIIGGYENIEPCAQWGIFIDEAFNTQIKCSSAGLNTLGCLSLNNIRSREDNNGIPISLENNYFGYSVFGIEDNHIVNNLDGWKTETGAIGIAMNNVQLPYFANTFIQGHSLALQINSVENGLFNGLYVQNTQGKGASLTNVKKSTFHSFRIGNSENNALEMEKCEDITLDNGDVQKSQNGYGASIRECKNTKFISWYFGLNLIKEGLIIDSSDKTTLQECTAAQNGSHGYVVRNGSANTVFDRGYADKNSGCGFLLENSSDITLYGSGPRVGLFIFNNKQNGMEIRNCQHVQVGYQGKGVNIVESGEHDILIDGETTNDVQITASEIMVNTNITGGYGVYAKNGKNIVIGGYDPSERNNFEFGNYAGVAVEGEKAEVSIINNLIGEIEEMESGTQKWGNLNGIVLQNKARNVLIEKNTINANKNHGIWLKDGANHVRILHNQITENGQHGIFIEGAATLANTVSANSISRNQGKGIALNSGGNTAIIPPVIQKIRFSAENIRGVADAQDGSVVEVFADPDDEGLQMIGKGIVYQQGFQIACPVPQTMNMHATVTDPNGNTSEFGPAFNSPAEESVSLVYTSQLGGNEEIYLQSPLASSPARLTEHTADDYDPQFSLDGSKIVFVSKRAGNADIWRMNNDGTNANSLTNDPAADYDPDGMHPEGKITYVSERDGNPEIYIQGTASSSSGKEIAYFQGDQTSTISAEPGERLGVLFSNFNSLLKSFSFYVVYKPYDAADVKWKIFKVDEGKPTNQILAEGTANPADAGWCKVSTGNLSVPSDIMICLEYNYMLRPSIGLTASGEANRSWRYAFSRWDKVTHGYIMIKAEVAGESAEQADLRITNNTAIDRYPAWSPDGKQIAYASNQTGIYEIWVMNADGTSPRQITKDLGNCIKPTWSPDGKKIAFASDKNGNSDIYLLDISSSTNQRLTETESPDIDPVWSRNGKTLFFASNRESGQEIYAVNMITGAVQRSTFSIFSVYQPNCGPGIVPVSDSPSAKQVMATKELGYSMPAAVSTLTLTVDSITAKPGDSFTIPVRVESGPMAGNIDFDLTFDEDVLEWPGTGKENFLQNAQFAMNPESFPTYLNHLRFNWVKAEGFTGNAAVITMLFKLKASAEKGEYPVRLANVQTYDIDLHPIAVKLIDGKVVVDTGESSVIHWMLQ